MTPALRTAGLSKSFGAFRANSDVSLAFPHGVRHALIGPNGAGKTTLINLVTGMLAPDAGEIVLGGEDITAVRPELGASAPVSMLTNVVLPAPFGPIRAWRAPASRRKSMFCATVSAPKDLQSFSV